MDGRPLRDHLESIARQTGVVPDQLADAPTCPEGMEGVWSDFLRLHSMRGNNGVGPSRISFADIHAMNEVRGFALPPWQVEAILAADAVFFQGRAAS